MNYRRGLQRLYAVLASAWFLLVLFMVAADRWLWVPWHVFPATGEGLAKEYRVSVSQVAPVELSPAEVTLKAKLSFSRKAESVGLLSLPFPVLGYVVLFWVGPWVYRGFRPTAPAG
jgi:hypothetical protein